MSEADSVIRVAVIGCGRWGPNHIRNFSALAQVKVAAAVDPDAAQRARIAQTFPGIKIFPDIAPVLKDHSIQAVIVATPTATHYQVVGKALRARKHVLCEKPLCQTPKQAKELAALARRSQRILMVGHVFLFNGGIIKIKELIDTGELGKLHYMSAIRTNLGPIRNDVNAAFDLAAHDIAIFNWLLNDTPQWVSATGAAFLQAGIEDVVFISLKYPSGVYAGIHASWLNPKKVRQAIVVGSQKMATWDDHELSTPVAIYDRGANVDHSYPDYGEFLRVSMWDGDVRLPKVNLEEPLKSQDRHFIEAIRKGSLDRSDGEFSVDVVKALEGAGKSMKLNGKPVRLAR